MAAVTNYDLVVLGGGSGGYAAALRAGELGLSVALIERDLVGGTCLHRGCIPTKALLHAAEVADATRDAGRFGVRATLEGVDLPAVNEYAQQVVGRLHRGLNSLIAAQQITVIAGEGRLEAGDGIPVVRVGEDLVPGAHAVLATGSYAKTLPGLEIDGHRVLTSEHALQLTTLPRRAVVLGGGVIGVEFASAWRSFGVEVTVVEALPRLVAAEEPEVSAGLERAFRKRGITAATGTAFEHAEVSEDGVSVTLADKTVLEADVLLVAVGRGPATEGLGYSEAGVTLDRGFVSVDERLQTTAPGVYAVGDLVRGLQLAHRGFAHGIFVAEQVAHGMGRYESLPAPVADREVPRVTYCDPEIASVGLGEAAAREEYGEVETLRYDLAGNGKSQILKTAGFVKLIRRAGGPVVGVHLLGSRVSELVGEAQLITGWDAYPDEVASLVHAHPTQSEALGEAHLALAGKPLHAHS
ncbi:MAG TPA: dihydrolipoyl dehydrogenase [Microlunatus sp.]